MNLRDTRNEQILKHACILYEFLSYRSNHIPESLECVIGLGSADIGIANVCYNFAKQYHIKQVIFTGKGGKNSAYQGNSEAYKMRNEFLNKSTISDVNIILEEEATNTYENIYYIKEYVNCLDVKKILLIGKPYQMQRCQAICTNQISNEIQLYFSSSVMSLEQYIDYNEEENILSADKIIQELVDEVSHLIIGSKYLILSHVEIPNDIIDSYTYLLNHGFQNRLDDKLIQVVLERWKNLDILDSILNSNYDKLK